MEKNTKHHGQFIDGLIHQSGRSLQDIADELGVNPSTIHRWKSKERLDPIKLWKISQATRIDIEGIFPQVDNYIIKNVVDFEKKVLKKEDIKANDRDLRDKYLIALEELNKTQNQLSDYIERYYKLEKKVTELESGQKRDNSKK